VTQRPLYPRAWLRLPRQTIRLRLTLLYGALFLASGAALLTVTYLLVEHQYTQKGAQLFITSGTGGGGGFSVGVQKSGVLPQIPDSLPAGVPNPIQVKERAAAISNAALNKLLIDSGIALAIMAVLSIWLGWLIAGRALRPLRTITHAARDISASNLHKRLALHGPDDEITQLGTTFNDLLERLEASFDAQRQFVANASHELRTPLTLERALVEVALADPDANLTTLRQMGEQVLAAGEQQERLIEALLTLSRSQRGLDRHEQIDLTATTAEALHALDTSGLSVNTSLQPASTSGDPRLVERLIANLLTNAARHNLAHGRIDVRTETRAGLALLAIDNSGPLVPADQLERLFQPFQRLDRERTDRSSGLGLGLSIVQAIADAHHAALTAEPGAGGGLHVEVGFMSRLPSGKPRPAEPAAPDRALVYGNTMRGPTLGSSDLQVL
jgi:signal transduction histidine kinase